jgi:phage regulator Rha-like protein
MRELIPKDKYGVFADNRDTVRVDSCFVARLFEKDHRHVLRDIENLDCSEKFMGLVMNALLIFRGWTIWLEDMLTMQISLE